MTAIEQDHAVLDAIRAAGNATVAEVIARCADRKMTSRDVRASMQRLALVEKITASDVSPGALWRLRTPPDPGPHGEPCTRCDAPAGRPCVDGGKPLMGYHAARWAAYEAKVFP